jgi:ketosteroid isomerase-like protein
VFALQDAGNRIGAVFRNPCLCLAFYADDAVVLPPNDTTATSKESISKAVGDLLTLPSLTIDWQPAKIEVARSGDIAYAPGRV